jgi:serine protease Do
MDLEFLRSKFLKGLSLSLLSIVAIVAYDALTERSVAEQNVMQNLETEIQKIFDRTKDSVVQIKTIVAVKDPQKGDVINEALGIGTGFFVDKKGHIFTAASILRGSKTAVVYWRGKAYEAQCVGQDPRTNLALLKIDAETPFLPVGEPDSLKIGSMALAIGYPADSPISAEYGYVSNLGSAQIPQVFATTHIRSSVRAQPGQSGSPFLNSKGEVVGIVTYALQDGSSTFALPITAAQKIQRDFLAFNEARHGWTGLTIELKNTQSSEGNIAIRDVYQGCPGHSAGIEAGDLLVRIGDKKIQTPADVMNATFYLSVGEVVNFTVERDGEEKVFPVKVAARPTEQEMLVLKTVGSAKNP